MSDKEILMFSSTLKTPVKSPDKYMADAIAIFESQISPIGLTLKNFRFDSELNYTSYMHPEYGVFCVCKFKTLYSSN